MAKFYGVQIGERPSDSNNDQGNQNLPEMRRQDLFRRAGSALPRCVLKSALGNFPDAAVAGGVDPDRSDAPSVADENGAPNNKKSASAAELLENWAITNYWRKSVGAVRAWYFAPGRKVSTAQSL